ncbi:MAG: hypothetical protein WAN86_16970 [Hyphomicrobiaceae bacterium]
MADDTDLRAFVHERYRRTDEKLDKVIDGIAELRQMVSDIVQILASHDQHMVAMEVRLGKIEKRLDLYDLAIPG